MNDTIKAILGILEDGTPEVQIAAAQVLGALKPREVAVSQALAERLTAAEDYLGRHLLTALASIGTSSAVKILVRQLEQGGPHSDLVAHLLGDIGKNVCDGLASIFDEAAPETQVRILGILRRVSGAQSLAVMEKALLIPELSHRAGDAMIETHLDRLETRSRKALKDRLLKVLNKRAEELSTQSLAVILRLLGRLDAMGCRATILAYAEKHQPSLVRDAALSALEGVRLTPTQASAVLEYLGDADRKHVVEPAMRLLAGVEKWSTASVQRLRRLMSSRHPHLRVFAVRAMRSVPTKEIVKALMQHLLGDSADMSEAAAEALGQNPAALEPLLRSFQLEKQIGRARLLAQPLRQLSEELPDDQVRALTEKGTKLLIGHEPKAELVLELVLNAQPQKTADLLVEKAIRLRRSRRLHEALALLAFLAQHEALDLEGRYQLALARLLFDSAEARADNHDRAGDATMGYFSLLVRDGFPVLDRLKKESMVKPEALLRVGTHFSEGVGSERRFGSDVLHHVADKHGRQRAGEEARMVLRAEGL